MSEFQKGDKVRCLEDSERNIPTGAIGFVQDDSTCPIVDFNDYGRRAMYEHELELVQDWTIVHPYNHDAEMPADPKRYKWEYYHDGTWRVISEKSVKRDFWTYRYRLSEPRSKLSKLAELLGVDEDMLDGALKELLK